MQLDRERGHVADHLFKLFLRNVPGQWNGVEPCTADSRLGQHFVYAQSAFAPALCQKTVFENREHRAGIARVLHRQTTKQEIVQYGPMIPAMARLAGGIA
jgi:hypothetical protein